MESPGKLCHNWVYSLVGVIKKRQVWHLTSSPVDEYWAELKTKLTSMSKLIMVLWWHPFRNIFHIISCRRTMLALKKKVGMCHFNHSILSLSEPSLLCSHHTFFLKSSALFDGLLTRWEVKWSESLSVVSDSLWLHGLYSPWSSPGQNTGVGSLSLLQGIFPTQGSDSGLLHCRQILYELSHRGSPRIPEWVAYHFSSRSSRPRNQTWVSCTASGFFTNWPIC